MSWMAWFCIIVVGGSVLGLILIAIGGYIVDYLDSRE